MGTKTIELIAVAVPGVYLVARILAPRRWHLSRNLGWALFSVPLATGGVLEGRPLVAVFGAATFFVPYGMDRLFDGVWPRRR